MLINGGHKSSGGRPVRLVNEYRNGKYRNSQALPVFRQALAGAHQQPNFKRRTWLWTYRCHHRLGDMVILNHRLSVPSLKLLQLSSQLPRKQTNEPADITE
jgi:hypothetical protein